jgi:hypothetical protein
MTTDSATLEAPTLREQVARVIDREAFTEGPWMWTLRQADALAKADDIIALLAARPAGEDKP